jgi:hypothetical protein
MRTHWRSALMMVLMSGAASLGHADEIDELRKLRDTTINLVNALVEQGVLSREKADKLIAQAEQSGKGGTAPASGAAPAPGAAPDVAPGVVRVPYVPESVREAITDEVKKDVMAQAKTERWGEPGAFPEWLRKVDLYGDVRFRYEADRFPRDNTPNAPVDVLQAYGVNIANSTDANNRLRVRARFGVEAKVADTVTLGMRLATGGVGTGSNPGSENQTLGNYATRSSVGFDRAYIAYHPLSWLELSVGRVGNPYFTPTTLIWADDVSLEGIVASFRPQLAKNLSTFTTVGAFPILQVDPTPTNSAASKWLYAYQTGFEWRFQEASAWRFGVALYDYRHIEGTPNPSVYSTQYDATAAGYRQTGNTVFDINGLLNTQNGTQNYLYGLASKFDEANASTSIDLAFVGPSHVIIDADYVRNLGFKEGEIIQRTGYAVDREVVGWQTRVTVGYPSLKHRGAWQAYAGYRYVQRDATLDAFTDQDFHLGGTDAQGYFLGAKFAFADNAAINARWFSAKQIDGVQLAGADATLSGLPLAIDVLQIDITAAF